MQGYISGEMKSIVVFSIFAILAFSAIAQTRAQISVDGKCQTVVLEQDFDVNAYLGLWYEYQRYPAFFEIDAKCVTATYTANANGTVGVLNSQVDSVTGERETIEGWAQQTGAPGEGNLTVYFPSVGATGKYWILDTDYTNYTVVWSCAEQAPVNSTLQTAWVLTREMPPTQETIDAAQAVIDANRLVSEFIITDHTNCPAP